MKKVLSMLGAMLLVFTLGACGAEQPNPTLVEMEEIFDGMSEIKEVIDYSFEYDKSTNTVHTEVQLDSGFLLTGVIASYDETIAIFQKLNTSMYKMSISDDDFSANVSLKVNCKQINTDKIVTVFEFKNGMQLK